jgi:hypothetical protein
MDENTPIVHVPQVLNLNASRDETSIILTWNDPGITSLDHIEITFIPKHPAFPDTDLPIVIAPRTRTWSTNKLIYNATYEFFLVCVTRTNIRSEPKAIVLPPIDTDTVIAKAIEEAEANALRTGYDGSRIDNPFTITIEGLTINDANTGKLFAALTTLNKNFYSIDLAQCNGDIWKTTFTGLAKNKIVSLVLPQSMSVIEPGSAARGAFDGYSNLRSITGEGITGIGDNAFQGLTGLAEVNFESVISIGKNAFKDCSGILSLDFPEARGIDEGAFYQCTNLIEITIPKANSLGTNAFNGCQYLLAIDTPDVTYMGFNTFYQCTSLMSVKLTSLQKIPDGAFYQCINLTTIDFGPNNNNILKIGAESFYECRGISAINFPNADIIGDNVNASIPPWSQKGRTFYGCTGLKSVYLPSFYTVEQGTFEGCSNAEFTNIYLPKVEEVNEKAFYDCTGLLGIYLPEATKVMAECFSFSEPNKAASRLQQVIIPKLNGINAPLFVNCSQLRAIYLNSTAPPTITNTGALFGTAGSTTSATINIYRPSDADTQYLFATWKGNLASSDRDRINFADLDLATMPTPP